MAPPDGFSRLLFLFRCTNENNHTGLPSTSVIICFYNEHPATLFRSITSILSRTPSALLHQIVLMNDFSEYPPDLHEITEKFVRSLQDKRVQVYRTSRREGLIRARMLGAKHATGKVWRLLISVTLSNYSCLVFLRFQDI